MSFIHEHTGNGYRDFLLALANKREARTYLEVGVRYGETLTMMECDCIGVDPQFQFRSNPVGSKKVLHLFQMTSDRFFRQYDPRVIFGQTVDLIFLDGLHQFEYLLRDFIASERIAEPGSLIVLDDCLPLNVEMTERQHEPSKRKEDKFKDWWTGDVWKMLPILRKYRPDLRIVPVDTQATGSVCITKLDPTSNTLKDSYFQIIDEFKSIQLDDDKLQSFYETNRTVSSREVLRSCEASLFLGV